MKTPCPDLEGIFLSYTEGRFEDTERALLQAHVGSCPRCRQRQDIGELIVLWSELGHLPAITPSPGFQARLQARLAQEEARLLRYQALWYWPNLLCQWMRAPALAALAALVLNLQAPLLAAPDLSFEQPATARKLQQLPDLPTSDLLVQLVQTFRARGQE